MKTIFDACEPREEVLKGELREQQFAASLTRVLRGDADLVYGDAATFFANTYPTSGLKSLLQEGLGRLTGVQPDSAPVIRLETSFGGGKTHNLIGLYHLARGSSSRRTFNPRARSRRSPVSLGLTWTSQMVSTTAMYAPSLSGVKWRINLAVSQGMRCSARATNSEPLQEHKRGRN